MKISCGILPYRVSKNGLEVFLVHNGGPFFANKDLGYWSIVKGEVNDNEDFIDCAVREFKEEVSIDLNSQKDQLMELGFVIQSSNKKVYAWAIDYMQNITVQSNLIEIEWPPKTGKKLQISEIDRGEFFDTETAQVKINQRQKEFIERLLKLLKL